MSLSVRVRSSSALRAYIALTGASERQLARAAGISHSTLNHLLTGRRASCEAETARAIERALNCPPDVFFGAD